jgi:hypothetical protein
MEDAPMTRPTQTPRHRAAALSLALAAACADGGGHSSASAGLSAGGWTSLTSATTWTTTDESGGMSSTGGPAPGGANSGGTTGGTTGTAGEQTSVAATDDPTAGAGLKFDLDTVPDGGLPPADTGCSKVDLLFVIDNSGSMADEQIHLINSFPEFVAEMQAKLVDAGSYHVGVVTTDSNEFNAPPCQLAGALVTQTGGKHSSDQVCAPYASGKNYMSEADDLGARFACAGQVGTDGDGNEQPMYAMQQALDPALAGPGGCNDGFVRPDALLVVVVITDEEDDHELDACDQSAKSGSPGEPPDWYDGLVAAKGGVESNIVVLALVGPTDASCPMLDKCNGGELGAELSPRLVQFAEMFTYGSVGQICAPSYKQFFSDAISVIDTACENFTPPG